MTSRVVVPSAEDGPLSSMIEAMRIGDLSAVAAGSVEDALDAVASVASVPTTVAALVSAVATVVSGTVAAVSGAVAAVVPVGAAVVVGADVLADLLSLLQAPATNESPTAHAAIARNDRDWDVCFTMNSSIFCEPAPEEVAAWSVK